MKTKASPPPETTARKYIVVWLVLLVLAGVSFGQAYANLGVFNTAISLTLAVVQMLLVVLFFMHVRHEKPLTWIFVAAGVIWLAIMFNLTLSDYLTRRAPIHQILKNRVGTE